MTVRGEKGVVSFFYEAVKILPLSLSTIISPFTLLSYVCYFHFVIDVQKGV